MVLPRPISSASSARSPKARCSALALIGQQRMGQDVERLVAGGNFGGKGGSRFDALALAPRPL